jgi:hypothetical protein
VSSPEADFQPYPDEFTKIGYAMARIEQRFEFKEGGLPDRLKAEFEGMVREEFDKIGIKARVNWKEICRQSPLGEFPTGVFVPGIEPYARSRAESETDHDRTKWGIVHGLADGQPGYVREDGTRREDPKKKLILP